MDGFGPLDGQYDLHAREVGVSDISSVNLNPDQGLAGAVIREPAEVAVSSRIAVAGLQEYAFDAIRGLGLGLGHLVILFICSNGHTES
jgi:hypothetical protein